MYNKKDRNFKNEKEYKEYIRDTVASVIVLATLFISPIAITAYESYKTPKTSTELNLEDYLATPSTPSNANTADTNN